MTESRVETCQNCDSSVPVDDRGRVAWHTIAGEVTEHLRALARLDDRGESQTKRGHAHRRALEDLWPACIDVDREMLDAHSADLRLFHREAP